LTYLIATILGLIAVEFFIRLSIIRPVWDVLTISKDSLRIIRSADIPDEEKQRTLLKNSWRSFLKTSLLAFKLLILTIVVICIYWLLFKIFSFEYVLIYKKSFWVTATAISIVYAILRNRFV